MATREEIEEKENEAYRKYQLLWMIEHGYSLDDLFEVIAENLAVIVDVMDLAVIVDVMDDVRNMFLLDSGFNGECFACKDEFLDSEYQDPEYVEKLNNL